MQIHSLIYFLVSTWGYFQTASGQFINCEEEENRDDIFVQFNAWRECEWRNGVISDHVTKCIIKDEIDGDEFYYLKSETISALVYKRDDLSHLARMSKEKVCNQLVKSYDFESIEKMVEPQDILKGSFWDYIKGTGFSKPKVLRLIEKDGEYLLRDFTSGKSNLRPVNGQYGSYLKIEDTNIAGANEEQIMKEAQVPKDDLSSVMELISINERNEQFCAFNKHGIYINENSWTECQGSDGSYLEKCIINISGDRFEYIKRAILRKLIDGRRKPFDQLEHMRIEDACNALANVDNYYNNIVKILKKRNIKESTFSRESLNAKGPVWKWDGQKHTKVA